MPDGYVADRGDIAWLTLHPQAGREQAGRRPVLILSPASYNGKVGLALACPITGRAKGYPFEVRLPEGLAVSGVVLSDHIKSLDWRARKADFACPAPSDVTAEVIAKLRTLIA